MKGLKDFIETKTRKGREPLGKGYGVHKAGECEEAETGELAYKRAVKQHNKDRIKESLLGLFNTLGKFCAGFAEKQQVQQPEDRPTNPLIQKMKEPMFSEHMYGFGRPKSKPRNDKDGIR